MYSDHGEKKNNQSSSSSSSGTLKIHLHQKDQFSLSKEEKEEDLQINLQKDEGANDFSVEGATYNKEVCKKSALKVLLNKGDDSSNSPSQILVDKKKKFSILIRHGQKFKLNSKENQVKGDNENFNVSSKRNIQNSCKKLSIPRIQQHHIKFKLFWEIFLILCGIFLIFMTPLQTTFLYYDFWKNGDQHHKAVYSKIKHTGYFIDIIFILDFVKNCITTYIDEEKQVEELNLKKIISRYYQKGGMLRDFIVCLPYSFIVENMNEDSRHFLLIHLIRAVKINNVYQQLRISVSIKLKLRIFYFFLVLFIISHIVACYFFQIIEYYHDDEPWKGFCLIFWDVEEPMVYLEMPTFWKYTIALYYASVLIHHVMDPASNSPQLSAYCVVIQLIGRVFLVILISRMEETIREMFAGAEKRQEVIDFVYDISIEYNIPSGWTNIFKEQVLINYERSKFDEDFKRIFQKLPQQMFDEVTNILFLVGVRKCYLFENLNQKELKLLIRNMEPLICRNNEKIYKKYDKAEHVYIVIKGQIELYNTDELDDLDAISDSLSKNSSLNMQQSWIKNILSQRNTTHPSEDNNDHNKNSTAAQERARLSRSKTLKRTQKNLYQSKQVLGICEYFKLQKERQNSARCVHNSMIAKVTYKQLSSFVKWYPNIEKQMIQTAKKYQEEELNLLKQALGGIPYLKNYREDNIVFDIFNSCSQRVYSFGDYLYKRGQQMKEEMYIVAKGTVSITMVRRNGEEITVEYLQMGTIIGLYGMFDKRRMIYNLKIDSPRALLLIIKKQSLVEILEKERIGSILKGLENNKRLDFSICPSINKVFVVTCRQILMRSVLKMMSGFYSLEMFQQIKKNNVGILFKDLLASTKNFTQLGLKCFESEEGFYKFWELSQKDPQVKDALRKILIVNIRFQSMAFKVQAGMNKFQRLLSRKQISIEEENKTKGNDDLKYGLLEKMLSVDLKGTTSQQKIDQQRKSSENIFED